jgi:DNA invertase Pin-like site-specific DNA recombinase
MSDRPLIVYCRALTQQQKRSGLGLLAQQDTVRRYIDANPGRVLAELTEIERGRSKDRPQLKEALRLCRVYDARLIIARLDRLARSVAMIAGLLESDVDFVAAGMPLANRFTIHILAAVAEYGARLISERTSAALAAAKARERKFGNPNPLTHRFSYAARKARVRAERERSKERALDFLPLLCQLRDRGLTIQGIANHLTASRTPLHAAEKPGVMAPCAGCLSMLASGSRRYGSADGVDARCARFVLDSQSIATPRCASLEFESRVFLWRSSKTSRRSATAFGPKLRPPQHAANRHSRASKVEVLAKVD